MLTMNQSEKEWSLSAILLAAAGASLVLTGLYFLLWRPPLLPEDIRFMALPDAQLESIRPKLEAWLSQVFRVMAAISLLPGFWLSLWPRPPSGCITGAQVWVP